MTCTECGARAVKTEDGTYECPICCNVYEQPAKTKKNVSAKDNADPRTVKPAVVK